MITEKERPENTEVKKEDEVKELEKDGLDQVAGAGNPFENIPRVPLQPIDPELREKG